MFPSRILLIEDSPTDAELMSIRLKKGGAQEIVVSDEPDEIKHLLHEDFDLIISDYNLPGFKGIDTLKWARDINPMVAFIICSGAVGDEKAAEVIKTGADDFISKDNIRERLNISAERAFDASILRQNEFQARKELALTSDRMATILANIYESTLLISRSHDQNYRLHQVNEQFIKLLTIFNPNAQRLNINLEVSLFNFLNTLLKPSEQLMNKITYGIEKTFKQGDSNSFRESLFTNKGERIILEFSNIPINQDQALILIRNITDNVETEEHILNMTLKAQEKERKRLSYELHDSIGQSLSASVLSLNKVIGDDKSLSPDSKEKLENALTYTNTAIQEARAIAHNLLPKSVEESGIESAVSSMLDAITMISDLQLGFNSNLNGKRLVTEIEINLFRICQEALNNIIRHSQASEASIQIMLYDEVLILTIDDNGKGFDSKESYPEAGIGVGGMLSRTRAIGGEFEISSHIGRGTHILVEIPLNPKS